MLFTEQIPTIPVSETVMEMAVSETQIMVVSEMLIPVVVSETAMADSEMAIQEASETVIREVSEIHNQTVDSVTQLHKQDLTIIISNHSPDIMEASDLMIREASDPVEVSMAEAAASEAVPAAVAE